MPTKTARKGWSDIETQMGLVEAHLEFIKSIHPTHFVTFNFNRRISAFDAQKSIKHFMNTAQRQVLGVRWHKKPISERLFLIAIPEHMETKLHYHGFLRAGTEDDDADKWTDDVIHTAFHEKWKSIEKRGSINIQSIYDLDRCVNYVKKEMWKKENMDSIFVYSNDKNLS